MATKNKATQKKIDKKLEDLQPDIESGQDKFLTTDQGLKINDDQNSLKAGESGAILLEDFILREKITHFDHERIPERIVHARGSAAHGFFECYESMEKDTKAGFLQAGKKTPVFVRFSTVAASRGSTDLAKDVRGFSVKFYTDEGNYDLVGNNMPVFFIQDAIKFPDLIHAVKPEPDKEIPQAASAHMIKSLVAAGAQCKIIAPKLGEIQANNGKKIKVDQSFLVATSVVFDAVYIPGGEKSVVALTAEADALHFVNEAYKHCKPVAADTGAKTFLENTFIGNVLNESNDLAAEDGVVTGTRIERKFINAIKQHRFWERENKSKVPA